MKTLLTTDKYTVKSADSHIAIEHADRPHTAVECYGNRRDEVLNKIEEMYRQTGNSKTAFYPVADAYFDSLYFD